MQRGATGNYFSTLEDPEIYRLLSGFRRAVIRQTDYGKENQTIPTGTIIDRYGSEYGKYTSPEGVPYEKRALPYIENQNAYHKYKVLKQIDNVTISKIAPAFNEIGGGLQYELPNSIKELKSKKYIEEIK